MFNNYPNSFWNMLAFFFIVGAVITVAGGLGLIGFVGYFVVKYIILAIWGL